MTASALRLSSCLRVVVTRKPQWAQRKPRGTACHQRHHDGQYRARVRQGEPGEAQSGQERYGEGEEVFRHPSASGAWQAASKSAAFAGSAPSGHEATRAGGQ